MHLQIVERRTSFILFRPSRVNLLSRLCLKLKKYFQKGDFILLIWSIRHFSTCNILFVISVFNYCILDHLNTSYLDSENTRRITSNKCFFLTMDKRSNKCLYLAIFMSFFFLNHFHALRASCVSIFPANNKCNPLSPKQRTALHVPLLCA